MDRTTTDHSDSDSGDSWTLIENNSMYADDALDVPNHPAESITAEHRDKDEDTDGISIITDSEPESSSPCEINCEQYPFEESSKQEKDHIPQFNAVNSNLHDVNNHNESKGESNDFLGDSGEKHKTYVHRRNKRLGTVLNIIMLGSVITAAGVAIGHMWGAKTDCSMHTSPNVNKILSNLYKLQEENAYLWNKVKELTALNNHQCQIMNQQKTTMKQNKCKKIFEEPLINNDSKKVTKCVDDKFINDGKLLNKQMVDSAQDNEFLLKVGSFKNAYQENQKWLDDETAQGSNHRPLKKIKPRHISSLKNNLEKENSLNEIIYIEENNQNEKTKSDEYLNETEDLTTGRKSYADSVNYDKNIQSTNSKENKAFKPDYRLYENKNLLKHDSEIDFSLNNRDKHLNINNNNWFENYNRLKEEYGYEFDLSKQGKTTKTNFNYLNQQYLFNDFNIHKRHHNIKKRESNKTFKVATQDFDTNEMSKENSEETEAEDKLSRSLKDKKLKRESFKTKNKTLKIKSKDFDRTKITEGKDVRKIKDKNQKIGTKSEDKEAFQTEYKTFNRNKTPDVKYDSNDEIVRNMKDSSLKKITKKEDDKTHQKKNKGNKKETAKEKYDTEERKIKDQNLNIQNKNQAHGIKRKSFHTNKSPNREFSTEEDILTNIKDTKIKENSEKTFTMKSTDTDLNETPNNENNSKKRVATKNNDFIKDKKAKDDNTHYQSDISDEDLKRDNRYIGQKQKQERKKFDRQQSHKKVKRRNKYEQWEMKGGLFKDYDDISMSSSQDNEYSLNTPNVDINHHHTEGSNSNIGNVAANLNHDHEDYPKSTLKGNKEDDQLNWLDKRAAFRTEARQKLDQESIVNNGVNAAGWYFRRMRKREQSRDAADNSTYRKLLKRKF